MIIIKTIKIININIYDLVIDQITNFMYHIINLEFRRCYNMATCEKLAKCPFYQGKMDMNSGLGSKYPCSLAYSLIVYVPDFSP